MQKNVQQAGFSIVEFILVLVILSALGFVGMYVVNARNNANSTLNAANTSADPLFKKKAKAGTDASKATTATPAPTSSTTAKSAGSSSQGGSLQAALNDANPNDTKTKKDMSDASNSLQSY